MDKILKLKGNKYMSLVMRMRINNIPTYTDGIVKAGDKVLINSDEYLITDEDIDKANSYF